MTDAASSAHSVYGEYSPSPGPHLRRAFYWLHHIWCDQHLISKRPQTELKRFGKLITGHHQQWRSCVQYAFDVVEFVLNRKDPNCVRWSRSIPGLIPIRALLVGSLLVAPSYRTSRQFPKKWRLGQNIPVWPWHTRAVYVFQWPSRTHCRLNQLTHFWSLSILEIAINLQASIHVSTYIIVRRFPTTANKFSDVVNEGGLRYWAKHPDYLGAIAARASR